MSSEPRHVRAPASAAITDALSDARCECPEEVNRMSSEPRHVRATANATAIRCLPYKPE
jgi:hypothetical protein